MGLCGAGKFNLALHGRSRPKVAHHSPIKEASKTLDYSRIVVVSGSCSRVLRRVVCSPMNTRRQFLISAPLGLLVAAAACRKETPSTNSQSVPTTAGAPPTFGTGAGAGPQVTTETFAEAEKLMQVTMTAAERKQAADTWRTS